VNGRGTAGENRQYNTVGREKYRNNGCDGVVHGMKK